MKTSPTPTIPDNADQYARRVATLLTQGLEDMPYDISERLRASRVQALAKRKVVMVAKPQAAASIVTLGSVIGLGSGDSEKSTWWNAVMSAIPVIALVVGMTMINIAQDEHGVHEVAEVDAALLTDDLPPEAYADPGFAQFLKISSQSQ